MKRLISTIIMALVALVAGAQGAVQAQTQQHSIVIDAESLAAVQTDVMSGVAIDKIQADNSRRPCARIKMHINRMSREEIDALSVRPVGGSVVVMKQMVASEGNGLIIELTAKQPTRFYLHSDRYGDSNEVSLNLEGNKEYRLEARLDISYIFVTSNVADAEVYIDNEYKGRTDSNFALMVKDIMPGAHKLKIQYGADFAERDINITGDNFAFRLDVSTKSARPQIVEFRVTPSDAQLIIDNHSYSADDSGLVVVALNKGTYTYCASADMYHDESGSFTVDESKVEKSIALLPNHGWIAIESDTAVDGAQVYIDDRYIGKAPIKSDRLISGNHKIRIIKELYLPYEESIIVQDNQTYCYTPVLEAYFATVTLNAGNDAEIYVNNEYKGISAWTGILEVGKYTFETRKENHLPTAITRDISATPPQQSIYLDAPTPITGTLDITSTPSAAEVYIDNQFVGTTPLRQSIIIGQHNIAVKAERYRSERRSITMTENATTTLDMTLQRGIDIADNEIEYVSSSKYRVENAESAFGANVKSHTWDPQTGKGVVVFDGKVTKIGQQAFGGYDISSITIPNSITTIGDRAFEDCNNLTSIIIPDNVTSIGNYAFWRCSHLSSVTLSEGLTTIKGYAFAECPELTSITIPNSVTTIEMSAFEGCEGLKSVTLEEGLTEITLSAFKGCTSLKSITIPDSVTRIGRKAFSGCTNLKSITIGAGVTSISNQAFSDCKNLTTVYCKATTPPSCYDYMFSNAYREIYGLEIYVPRKSAKYYKRADGWDRYWLNINGYNFR